MISWILKSKENLLQINQELNNKIKIAKNIIMKMGNILIKTVKIVLNFYRTKIIKIIKTITRQKIKWFHNQILILYEKIIKFLLNFHQNKKIKKMFKESSNKPKIW